MNVWYFISPHKTDEDFNLFQGKHRYQRTIKNKIKKKKRKITICLDGTLSQTHCTQCELSLMDDKIQSLPQSNTEGHTKAIQLRS